MIADICLNVIFISLTLMLVAFISLMICLTIALIIDIFKGGI